MKRRKTWPYARLTRPLVRDSGVLRPATWAEALDRAAAVIRRTLETRGPEAVGMFSCARAQRRLAGPRVRQRRRPVTSPHDSPVTHWNLCIQGRFGWQHVQNR